MKTRASTKIAIGSVVVVALAYFGYQAIARWQVDTTKFSPIAPGRVSLIAIAPGQGYRIIVANQVAQIGELSDPSQLKDRNFDPDSADTTNRKRIPMRELLECLQGKESAVGPFVMSLNDLNRDDLPPEGIVWKAEDIRKALDGDKALAQKLQHDTNANLDGTFPPYVSKSAIFNAMIIDSPVHVQVHIAGQERTLTGRIQEEFQTQALRQVASQFAEKHDVTDAMIQGVYETTVKEYLSKDAGGLRAELEDRLSPARLQAYAASPERVLASAQVVLNDSFITGASFSKVEMNDKLSSYTVQLDLTNEGRLRLWQFSRGRTGFQLLFVVDGVAIAAPTIRRELPFSSITISKVTDESLARSAVDVIQETKSQGVNR